VIDLSDWIPIFPLPNCVLLPRAVLPLHVFEDRYRTLTRDALSGPRLIAVALLKPCTEEQYFTLEAPIHTTVGVGRILREERLADGRFNFLLQGLERVAITAEDKSKPYRRAKCRVVPTKFVEAHVECGIVREMRRYLTETPLAPIAESAKWTNVLDCGTLNVAEKVDSLAALAMQQCCEKQRVLESTSLAERARVLFEALERLKATVGEKCQDAAMKRRWPPGECLN